ncbi:MAG: ABC transporter permease [Dysosmobacter sp.]|nr:ABC transporter permease [Dysosmobacter sp.]
MKKKQGVRMDKYLFVSVLAVCVGIFVWWLVTDGLGLFRSNVLPSPVKVCQTFLKKWVETKPDGATLLQHLVASLKVALGGYLIGALVGIPLGIFMAWNDKIDMLVRPVFDLVRTIPGVAWTSVMVTLVGIGYMSKALVIFISAMVAMVINSYSGIKQTKTVHLWVGQTFGASNWDLLTKVAIPSALPMIFTGLDVALGSAWTTLVAAELLASTRGLGFMIQQARGIFRLDIVIVGMVVIAITGAILSSIIRKIGDKVVKGGRLR